MPAPPKVPRDKKNPNAPPGDWIGDLRRHASKVREASIHYASHRGDFFHAETVKLNRKSTEGGDLRFEMFVLTAETQTSSGDLGPISIIEHLWFVATEKGNDYAAREGLTRMRGMLELIDAEGTILNDSDGTCRSLPEGGADPSDELEDEAAEADARVLRLNREVKDLRYKEKVSRAAIDAWEKSQMGQISDVMKVKESVLGAVHAMGEDMQEYYGARILALKQTETDYRRRAAFDAILGEFTPKVGPICDAFMVGARTFFGRQPDARQVQDMPPMFMVWIAESFGKEEFANLVVKAAIAKTIAPDHDDYTPTWEAVLMELEEGLAYVEAHKFPYPESKAIMCRRWGVKAVKSLGISTHKYSRVCKMKGDPGLDNKKAKDDAEKSDEAEPEAETKSFDEDVIDVDASEKKSEEGDKT